MRTVLESLNAIEASLLENQPQIEAIEQIDLLRTKLNGQAGATELLSQLQEECAPEAEKTKAQLSLVREAILILETQHTRPNTQLEPDLQDPSSSLSQTEPMVVEGNGQLHDELEWGVSRFGACRDAQPEFANETASSLPAER